MRKIIPAAIAAMLCIALAGCSGEKDSGGTGLDSVSGAEISSAETDETGGVSDSESDDSAVIQEDQNSNEAKPDETQPLLEETEPPVPEDVNYAQLINKFDNTYLGLPSADKVYIFSNTDSTAEIDGKKCYAVSCYDEYEGTLYYMCDFYITEDGGDVYRYYEQEERFALLPETQGFARLDPTRQSPEDIFAVAESLYMMFNPDTNSAVGGVDNSAPTEINGEVYVPVTNELFETNAELLDALDKYFSAEIVNALMDTNKFIEKDGALYVRDCDGTAEDPNFAGASYELTTLTDDTAVFTRYVTFEYEAGETEEIQTIFTALKQNGIWRFTDFPAEW